MSKLLLKENIIINHPSEHKENMIRKSGQLLVESGYVLPEYIDAMIERDQSFSVYLGNGLAIPHGIEASKQNIIKSGISIIVCPEGVDWDEGVAKVIVGIAGVGDEHIDILSLIAEQFMEEENVEQMLTLSVDDIYHMFKRK